MTVDTIDTLLELGMLKAGMRVLDVGCGKGNWAVDLIARGIDIHYVGLEAQPARVMAFMDRVKHPNYSIIHLDVKNMAYNPLGRSLAREVNFPVVPESFDLVICHSLFTHLGKFFNAQHYMDEIKKALKPQGYLWATFFQSPPNDPEYRTIRTVYTHEEIDNLTKDFHVLYCKGGETTDYNDQLMMGLMK